MKHERVVEAATKGEQFTYDDFIDSVKFFADFGIMIPGRTTLERKVSFLNGHQIFAGSLAMIDGDGETRPVCRCHVPITRQCLLPAL
jgi:hypothetical protein